MGTLTSIFRRELTKFNNGDYANLVFHPEVIMNEVDSPYGVHCGSDAVIDYLIQSQTAKNPQLSVITINEHPQDLAGKTHGQVSGEDATYQDDINKQGKLYPVRYIFNFRYDPTSNTWLIINATATAISTAIKAPIKA